MGAWHAWARLLRVSLFASAIGDPWLGYVLLGGTRAVDLLGLALSSWCVYHGAMALNDWADRDVDRARGRVRPLTTGALQPTVVRNVAFSLIALGVGLSVAFGLGMEATLCIALAALMAIAYDLVGRGAVLGPLLLASARGLNLLFGMAAGAWAARGSEAVGPTMASLAWSLVFAYAGIVALISALGRFEDGEASEPIGDRATRSLRLLSHLLIGVPLVFAVLWRATVAWPQASVWAWMGIPIAWLLIWRHAAVLRRFAARERWTPADVERAMGPALGSLSVFTAATLLCVGLTPWALGVGLVLLALQQLGRRLMRVIPPS